MFWGYHHLRKHPFIEARNFNNWWLYYLRQLVVSLHPQVFCYLTLKFGWKMVGRFFFQIIRYTSQVRSSSNWKDGCFTSQVVSNCNELSTMKMNHGTGYVSTGAGKICLLGAGVWAPWFMIPLCVWSEIFFWHETLFHSARSRRTWLNFRG